MNLNNLEKLLLKEARFRTTQAKKLLFQDLIDDWSQATVFPINLRNDLNRDFPINIKSELFVSKDSRSAKALIYLNDNSKIETALMVHKDSRNTACLSSQVSCPLACKFCASGASFKRSLNSDEIILQALFWSRYLKSKNLGSLSNVVFMGSGEPFLNYENVFKSIVSLNREDLFNISSRKISISTIGICDGIRKMTNEKNKVNLAISLHFSDDKTRANFMPGTKKYPLKKLFESIDYYIEKTNRKVMFEYMLIKGVNDSKNDAENLSLLMQRPLYMLNIIQHNKTGLLDASDQQSVINFKKVLSKNRVNFVERHRFNQDVFGACGQLSSF